jgi:hypothetical protein
MTDDWHLSLRWYAPQTEICDTIGYTTGRYSEEKTRNTSNRFTVTFGTDMLDDYEGYNITGLNLFPVVDEHEWEFTLYENGVKVGEGSILLCDSVATGEDDEDWHQAYYAFKWTGTRFDEPIALKPGAIYQLEAVCDNDDVASVGYDVNGEPMISLLLQSPDNETVTPDYYNLYIGDRKYNVDPITDTAYDMEFTEDGTYQIRIDTAYDETILRGEPISVTMYNGVATILPDLLQSVSYYTLSGLPISSPADACGPYIAVCRDKMGKVTVLKVNGKLNW